MKSISEITMLFHNNKNGKPKVWHKPIGVSTSCFYFLCWFWVFILLIVFLLDFLLWNQSCLKLFSAFPTSHFTVMEAICFFSWLCISISFESGSNFWVIAIIHCFLSTIWNMQSIIFCWLLLLAILKIVVTKFQKNKWKIGYG